MLTLPRDGPSLGLSTRLVLTCDFYAKLTARVVLPGVPPATRGQPKLRGLPRISHHPWTFVGCLQVFLYPSPLKCCCPANPCFLPPRMQESRTAADVGLGAQQVHGATPGKLFTVRESVSHQSRGPRKRVSLTVL